MKMLYSCANSGWALVIAVVSVSFRWPRTMLLLKILLYHKITQVTDKVNIGCPGILTPAVNYVLCLAGLQLTIRKVWWNYLSRQHFNSHLLLVYYTFCQVLFQMIDRAVSVTPAQFSGSDKYCMEWRKWGSWEWRRRQHYYSSAAGHCCRTYQCAVIRRQHQVETAIWDQVVAGKNFCNFLLDAKMAGPKCFLL